tara:strand:- start:559 stop:1260 length:702 start_codon:yes stop_codon:yes gene_type:complete
MNFLHIGGGAGDLDPSTGFQDGFSRFVKKHKSKIKNIFIIEANPSNIKTLRKSWQKYKSVKIFNFAITSKKKDKIKFFFSEKDAPYYQLFSSNIKHIKIHFPNSQIKSKQIRAVKINDFLLKYFKNRQIDYFSIDIEGSDYEVIMSLDLKKYNIQNISLEYLHLKKIQKIKILEKLNKNGYSYYGFGLDHNKIDWYFKKQYSAWNNIISMLLPIVHRKHYKRLNKLLIRNNKI